MKLSDLISSKEHRAEMWRRLYFNDAYFCRLWKELEHYNASPNRIQPPLTQEEMLMVALLMLAQQKSDVLDEAYKRAGCAHVFGSAFKWQDKDLEDPLPLFHRTDEDREREFKLLERLGIDSYLKLDDSEPGVFKCREVPIQEHPEYAKIVAKYRDFERNARRVEPAEANDKCPACGCALGGIGEPEHAANCPEAQPEI